MQTGNSTPIHRTSDLCDRHGDEARICRSVLASYGGRDAASGCVACVRVFEDAALLRSQLERPGKGRVLVVDAGGSLRVAVLGDRMARLGAANGWRGLIINGAVRDADRLATMDIAIFALGTTPGRGGSSGAGEFGVEVSFGGVTFVPGHYICLDRDGVILLPRAPPASC